MRQFVSILTYLLSAALLAAQTVSEDLEVVRGNLPNGVPPDEMVEAWTKQRVRQTYLDWKDRYQQLQAEGGWEAHHQQLRESLLESMGGFPERTPLNAKVTGEIERSGFRVEKILFESRPGVFVTGSLYVPRADLYPGKRPGVLVPCGHAIEAKAYYEYQSMGALLALNGFVAFVFDPMDQSERRQYEKEDGSRPYYGTHMHMQAGIPAMLLGDGLIQYFAWDGIRALDYLETRPEVDSSRLGISGNSGGGTQTSYIFALDGRLSVAAPSCWPHLAYRQLHDSMGDMEQMNYGMLKMGMEHPSFYLMRAPAPVKIMTATNDFFQVDAAWEGFRYLKRRYTDLGYSERADILENNAGHNYDRTQREGAVRWFSLWLADERKDVWEPELDLFSEEELWSTPTGQVMDLPGARSLFDLFDEKLAKSKPQRERAWGKASPSERREWVRELLGARPIESLPVSSFHEMGMVERDGYRIHKRLLETEPGIYLIVLDAIPREGSEEAPLLVAGFEGAAKAFAEGGVADKYVSEGRRVVAVDIRGVGETKQTSQVVQGAFFGTDQEDIVGAYLLGESFLGMRVEDILQVGRYVQSTNGNLDTIPVELVSDGQVGVAALHAAFLEPGLFAATRISGSLKSWESILSLHRSYQQLANAVQGGLLVYDLPHLMDALGETLQYESPVDALGYLDFDDDSTLPEDFATPNQSGLVGVFCGNPRFLNPQGGYDIDRLSVSYDNAVERRGNDWSGTWIGYLLAPATGEISFVGSTEQNMALKIEGEDIFTLDAFPGENKASLRMEKGKLYPIELRYQLHSGGIGAFSLSWEWEGKPREVVSDAYLRHSKKQAMELTRTWR